MASGNHLHMKLTSERLLALTISVHIRLTDHHLFSSMSYINLGTTVAAS
jgi:hypothetical protein